jgi:hypothetical protein
MQQAHPTRHFGTFRSIAWVPAVLLVVWGMLAANGVQLQPKARAATTGTVSVTATVPIEVHVTSTCGTSTLGSIDSIGTLAESADCAVTFGSNNNASGSPISQLVVENNIAAEPFLCYDSDNLPGNGRSCGVNKQFTDHAGAEGALVGGESGARGLSCTNGTMVNWTVGATNFNKIPLKTSPIALCNQTTAGTDATYTIHFGAKGNATMVANSGVTAYTGQALFTSLAS